MLIEIADDFSLEKIITSGQCFRAAEMENGYYQFIHNTYILLIRQKAPGLFEVNTDMQTWRNVWNSYFDLSREYSSIRNRIPSTDIFMKKASQEGTGIRILRQDPWEMLISFIISQRKSIPAIKQSVELLSERWGTPMDTPNGIVFAFPTPEQLANATEAELRACKVGYRASYIRHAVQDVLNQIIDLKALYTRDYAGILEALTAIKGVGRKVANCIALFSYGQMSATPVDTWIRKIITEKYAGIDPFPGYGDVAGIMQQYAFWYAQNHKEEF